MLPNNKSGSIDNLTYEHLKYGGIEFSACLAKVFNAIFHCEVIPTKFKSGLTIILHKGPGKPLNDPNSYRAISLLPVISKLYEKLVIRRLDENMLTLKLNELQYGFQKNKNCKMVSFIVQEARDCCIERGSPLHVSYMDAKSAFDLVWIHGLINKLFNFGIKVKLLRLICNSFSKTALVVY